MSSVATEKSTLTPSHYNSNHATSQHYNSLYSNWSPYVSPSEFSTTAPLQPLPPPTGGASANATFPGRKLMFKYSVQYKIPHAKLDSEC